MMNAEQRRAFVREHRTCIFAFQRKQGPPSMSVVYYTTHGDDILIATMAARAKARAVQRLGEASICVLDEKWPLTYLQLYGPARLDPNFDLLIDTMVRVGEIMLGQPLPREARRRAEEIAPPRGPRADSSQPAVDALHPARASQCRRRRQHDAARPCATYAVEGVIRTDGPWRVSP